MAVVSVPAFPVSPKLARTPLDELAAQLPPQARRLTLNELQALVAAAPTPGVAVGAPLSPDAIARAIVALPSRGSKLREVERAVVLHALDTCEGNRSAAARLLGINRKKYERMLARYASAR